MTMKRAPQFIEVGVLCVECGSMPIGVQFLLTMWVCAFRHVWFESRGTKNYILG